MKTRAIVEADQMRQTSDSHDFPSDDDSRATALSHRIDYQYGSSVGVNCGSRRAKWVSMCKRSRALTILGGILSTLALVVTFRLGSRERVPSDTILPWQGELVEPKAPPPSRRPCPSRCHVALCFFGLARSLRWTYPSIKSRVFDVLRDNNVTYDIFVHTYGLREVNNQRAGEVHVPYGDFVMDHKLLRPTRSMVTDQDDLDLAFPHPISMTSYRWIYYRTTEDAEGVIRNVFRAYWSMMAVWGLMAEYSMEQDVRYDAVVLLRPDVWFHTDIDLHTRTFPLPEDMVFLPDFETDEAPGGRKNDRFAYGSVTAMRIFTHRLYTLFEHNAERFTNSDLDSEWILGHHLQKHDISVSKMQFPVTRVRLDGDIPKYDHGRVEAACESGTDPMACEMVELGFKFPIDRKAKRVAGGASRGDSSSSNAP